jgi:hypothetical protein
MDLNLVVARTLFSNFPAGSAGGTPALPDFAG